MRARTHTHTHTHTHPATRFYALALASMTSEYRLFLRGPPQPLVKLLLLA